MGKNTSVWEGRKQSSDRLSSIIAIEGHELWGTAEGALKHMEMEVIREINYKENRANKIRDT